MIKQVRQKRKGISTIPVILLVLFIVTGVMMINFSNMNKIVNDGIKSEMALEQIYIEQMENRINQEITSSNIDQ